MGDWFKAEQYGPLASKTQPQYGPRKALMGGRRPTATKTCRAPAGHRQGPVGLGSSGNFYYRFFITFRRSEPVFYEYTGGKDYKGNDTFSTKLTWPQKNRNYYKKGDIILFHSISQKWIPRAFPTLARKTGKKSFLENIIDSEILGLSPDYKAAQVVTSIKPVVGKPGYGIVETKPILFFGETSVFLADEEPRTYNVQLLTNCRVTGKLSNTLNSIVPFLVFTSEVMMMVLTGAAKAAATKAASTFIIRKAAIHAVTHVAKKQALKAFLKTSAVAIAKGSLAFGIAFVKATGDKQEEALREAAGGKKVDYKVIRNAVRAGSEAFAATVINEFFGGLIGAGKITPAKEYIAKKITALFTTDTVIGVLIQSYRKAALDHERKRIGTKKQAGINMGKEMKGFFMKNVKGILKDVVGTFF